MFKKLIPIHCILVMLLVAFLLLPVLAVAGWLVSLETSFTGTTYTYWNTNSPARTMDFRAIYFRHASAVSTNTVCLYRVDASTNVFQMACGSGANLQYVVFTPDGNGTIRVPDSHGLRIVQTATNQAFIILDVDKPE